MLNILKVMIKMNAVKPYVPRPMLLLARVKWECKLCVRDAVKYYTAFIYGTCRICTRYRARAAG